MTLGDTNLVNNRPPPAELSFRFPGVFGSRGWQRETIELFVLNGVVVGMVGRCRVAHGTNRSP